MRDVPESASRLRRHVSRRAGQDLRADRLVGRQGPDDPHDASRGRHREAKKHHSADLVGSGGQDRTGDLRAMNPLLYH